MCPQRDSHRSIPSISGAILIPFVVVISGCAPQDIENDSASARFASYPTVLMNAVEDVCDDPASSFHQPNRNIAECRIYLPPQETAALILHFDGSPERLPQVVMRFEIKQEGGDYIVSAQGYAEVPQKSGAVVRINGMTSSAKRKLQEVYKAAGAKPYG